LIGFIPLYLVDTFGVRAETAARLLAIIYSAGIWAAPLAGWLSDHMGRLSLMIIVSFIAGPAIVLMNFISPGFGFYILLLLIGVYLFVRMPLSEAYLYGEVPSHLRSTLLGVYFFGSSLGGGAFTLLIGRIVDQYGFQRVFWISGVSLFVITVLCSAVIITFGMISRRVRLSS
jgi:MFS family permease